MSHAQKIRSTIASTQSTHKITKAMQLVAASKLGKAQERMLSSKPYAEKIKAVISHLATSHPEYSHPYLKLDEKLKAVGYIVISTDRGLCGGLNQQLFKQLLTSLRQNQSNEIKSSLCLVGAKSVSFFKHCKEADILAQATYLGDAPSVSDLIGVIKVILDAYLEGKIQRLYLLANTFQSVMKQTPRMECLLPIQPENFKSSTHWDYIYEPDAKHLLNILLVRYIESLVYQSVVDNHACEQAARMLAMQNATDNAKEIINDLQIAYNKARQASITQEIAEIVGGAEAV